PFYAMILVIALLLLAMQEYTTASWQPHAAIVPRWAYPLSAAGLVVFVSLATDLSVLGPGRRMYSGRDGVLILMDNGDLNWDGLWHSALSQGGNHIGTNNWYLASCPVLCHGTGKIKDVCVIGVATGITAATLAK